MAYPLQRRYGPKLQRHWSSLVAHDPASLHACICVSATNSALTAGEFPLRDVKKGSSLLLLDTFHHRGETIRLVNQGLSDPFKASGDPLIAAVSSLLTVEVRNLYRPVAVLTRVDCNGGSRLSEDPPCRAEADGWDEASFYRCRS